MKKAHSKEKKRIERGRRKREVGGWDKIAEVVKKRYINGLTGEVAEWLKAPVSKTGIPLAVSRVRIPASPLFD